MSGSLLDRSGKRKYLNAKEWQAFVAAASQQRDAIRTFCLTLAFTGARISEVMALTPDRIDVNDSAVVFETLKQRKRNVFRAVPIPDRLVVLLANYASGRSGRLWPWGRTTSWATVKSVLHAAGTPAAICKPKALRHAFAVEAGQSGVPLNIVQRWLGHARIETTAIYANVIGDEERNLARRLWSSVGTDIS